MSDKTISVVEKTPHPHVIAKLEEWLARARDGEIDGLLLVAETNGEGMALYSYAGRYSSRLVGGGILAIHMLMHKLEEED